MYRAQDTSMISNLKSPTVDWDSSVSTVAWLWKEMGSQNSILDRDRDFTFHRIIQTVLGLCLLKENTFSPPGLERPWYEADHSLVSRPEVKNA